MTQYHPDRFCIGPYTEVRINHDGRMNWCHAADNDLVPPEENITKINISDFFATGPSAIEARKSMQQGREIDRCHQCYKSEKAGLISFRHRRNIQAAIFPGEDFNQSCKESPLWSLPRLTQNPRFYHVSFGNLCNLACMMCDSQTSSLYAQTARRAGLLPESVPISLDWTQGPAWQQWCDHLLSNPDIECLHVMGGEPMYHKRFKELLGLLVENNHTDFEITVVTNGTIYDPNVIDLLRHFRGVQIEISIEGISACNDYIRWPSNTQIIQNNIEKYLEFRSQQIDVVIRTVPQLFSVWNYHELLSWCRDRSVAIDSNPLFWPPFFKVALMPEPLRSETIKNLEKFIIHETTGVNDINLRNRHRLEMNYSINAKSIIDMIKLPIDNVAQQWQQLTEYCKKMDRARRIDARDYVPHLIEYLEIHGYYD